MENIFFDFELDQSLISLEPSRTRGGSRLLVADAAKGTIEAHKFDEIIEYLRPGDLLVLNNSKVIPAKLAGTRVDNGTEAEFLLQKKTAAGKWQVLTKIKAKRPVKIKFDKENGSPIFAESLFENDSRFLKFDHDLSSGELESIGSMPVPPYIEKLRTENRQFRESDKIHYQTVYAKNPGSIAAPTAGLHFSNTLLDEIRNKGIEIAYITLHVGYGTFQPIRTDDYRNHTMEPEEFTIPAETLEKLINAKRQNRRIIATGTTSARVAEAMSERILSPGRPESITDSTNLYIYPGYNFRIVDMLITNFHLPKSTLLLLAAAFGGDAFIRDAYKKAMEENFLFYSYGDSMLIIK